MAKKRFFITDAMAMAFRSFWALGRNPLSLADGTPIAAVYASAVFMNKLLTEEKPDYLAVVRESREPGFRTALYKDYKATRDKMPDDLARQMPYFWQLFEAYGYPAMSVSGMEADDVIGTLAKTYGSEDVGIFIVSGDKDFMQLVDDNIVMYSPKKGEEAVIVDRKGVAEKFHCTPDRVIDCLALIGDTADNVPGVPGIGDKGAAALIETYGNLEGIYANIDQIKAKKQKENLIAHKDAAFLSRQLVTIKTDLALPVVRDALVCDWKATAFGPSAYQFYDKLGFKQLAAKAFEQLKKSGAAPTATIAETVPADFKADGPKEKIVIKTKSAFTNLMAEIVEAPSFAFHIDMTGDIVTGTPQGVAVAPKGKSGPAKAVYLSLEEGGFKDQSPEDVRIALKAIFEDRDQVKIGHRVKHDMHVLANLGIHVVGPVFDTGVADYLIDPNNSRHELGSCVERRLGVVVPSDASAADLALFLLPLWESYEAELSSRGLMRVLSDVEMPLVPVLMRMEKTGVFIDAEFLAVYSDKLDKEINRLEKEIFKEAGESFNINSSKQLQRILYEKLKIHEVLKLKRLKKTKTGFSTDESVLSQLTAHPVPKLIMDYREVTKLKNTYVDTLPQYVNPKTGRLHTHLNQTVAATGRLSSERPNLQNIPMRSPLGQEIRRAFKPENAAYTLVSADYSQVEIRLLAHLANADLLIEAFRAGVDVHRATAAKVFGVPLDKVTSEMRSQAKAINFGIIYGMGPQRLAGETGVTLAEAKEFIQKYFAAYPGIKRFTEGLIEAARKTGYSETITGRKRPIPGIDDKNKAMLARAENIAVNAPIQGSAADIIKLAMIKIDREIARRKLKGRMVLQVHDELLFECPESELATFKTVVKEGMEHAYETKVPLTVEIGSGKTWLDAH